MKSSNAAVIGFLLFALAGCEAAEPTRLAAPSPLQAEIASETNASGEPAQDGRNRAGNSSEAAIVGPVDANSDIPGLSNTGVPTGIPLEPSNSVTVTKDGTVIDRLDVDGQIIVRANDVTIRETRIRVNGSEAVVFPKGYRDLVVEDSEFDGGGTTRPAIIDNSYVLRRVNIHGFGDGPRISGDNVIIEDCYIWGLPAKEGSHNDGIQMTDGRNVVIRGNHIHNPNTQTSAILIAPDFGAIEGVTIENNILRGGGYTIYGWGTDITIQNNRIESGYYGPKSIGDNVVWVRNTDFATGTLIE